MSSHNQKKTNAVDANHIARCLDAGDDFAFEMEVLHVLRSVELRSVELSAAHGGTYIDPITSLPRQFDIRAKFTRPGCSQNSLRMLRMSIECKRLQPEAPLVISRSERTANESSHDYIRALSRLGVGITFTVISAEPMLTFYKRREMVGRSVTQIKSGKESPVGDADIYKQWSQAVASADDLIWAGARESYGPESVVHSVTLPCLVVPDGTLWTVDYNHEGFRSPPKETSSCEFYIGKPSFYRDPPARYWITHLHIFTKKGLEDFLIRQIGDTDYWSEHFPKE